MNDNELDTMLREHGTAWRNDNGQRPGIAWDAVTEAKRYPKALFSKTSLGVVAVAAAAAAVIVPLAVVGNSKPAAKPAPAHKSIPLKIAEKGAPAGFFAIAPPTISGPGGAFAFVQGAGTDSIKPGSAVAAGVGSNPNHGYEAFRVGPCKSRFYDLTFKPHFHKNAQGFVDNGTVATVSAQVARSAMAVSPDGKELAFVENRTLNSAGNCVAGPQELAILDLAAKTVVAINTHSKNMIESLAWAPDSRHLALELVPGIRSDLEVGVHVVDTDHPGGIAFDQGTQLSDLRDQPGGNGISAPITYLRGQLVTLLNGELRALGPDGQLGPALVSGLPKSAMSVSVDPTGQHLLVVAGPFSSTALRNQGFEGNGYSNEQEITVGTTYRWDSGHLSTVKDTWIDPAW